MDPTAGILIVTAATVALLHTVVGVDHYLPFIVLGKARGWSLRRTIGVTALCGLGHVVGSILIGAVGIGLGVAVSSLEVVEGFRGVLASWGLIAFGLTYAAWSFVQSQRGRRHTHVHAHHDGTVHAHDHDHRGEHLHPHAAPSPRPPARVSTWALFVLFVLGPCEALIPILMAPAALHAWWLVALVTIVFSAVTIVAMVAMVAVVGLGLQRVRFGLLERHAGTLAGLAIASTGVAIRFLGI